jgi:hypothetical protein
MGPIFLRMTDKAKRTRRMAVRGSAVNRTPNSARSVPSIATSVLPRLTCGEINVKNDLHKPLDLLLLCGI